MPTRWGDWGDDVVCQECHGIFERPEHLEAWEPAVRCPECQQDADALTIEARIEKAQVKRGRDWRLTEQILHPALMDVSSVKVRRPGEPGWAQAEAQGTLKMEEDDR